MPKKSVLDDLVSRGIINYVTADGESKLAVTNEDEIRKRLSNDNVKIYVGFDPTASSLHVGHLLPILTLAHFQKAGHTPIAVVGGATGLIGDPSGKSSERQLLTLELVDKNVQSIKSQLSGFLKFEGDNSAIVVNNHDWLGQLSYIDWLRDVGKYFTVNYMMAKESVRSRLEDRDQGISYTEFSYMLMQAYDFLHLFREFDCSFQGGGSDQWGNIVAGIDLIRRVTGKEAFGLTYPLVTTSSGQKFGKSEGNAVWLDSELTSPYNFFQFWINTEDKDVEKYLKLFTFLPVDEISEICQKHNESPEKRYAQNILAKEVTFIVHGDRGIQSAQAATSVLFGEGISGYSDIQLKNIFADVPATIFNISELENGIHVLEMIVRTGIAPSKGEARRLIDGGGLYMNNEKISSNSMIITKDNLASETMIVLRKGKKNFHLVKFI